MPVLAYGADTSTWTLRHVSSLQKRQREKSRERDINKRSSCGQVEMIAYGFVIMRPTVVEM